MTRPLRVTAISDEAREAAGSGDQVVLIVDALDAAGVGRMLSEHPPGPGLVHVFVGDPADPQVQAAAAEMAAELGARRGD